MKAEICAFGEVLLRYSPTPNGEWIRQGTLPVFVGGAELNVATALARWEQSAAYCTALPENHIADDIIDEVERRGVDSTPILRSGERIGCYYLSQGSDLKQGGVHYVREYSAFSELDANQVDWQPILENTKWLHLSAISPALNAGVARACKELVQAASEKGITISMDLNHRAQLWNYGAKPTEVMPELVEHCDIVMGNIWSANALLGIPLDADIHAKGKRFRLHRARPRHGSGFAKPISALQGDRQYLSLRYPAHRTSVLRHARYGRKTIRFAGLADTYRGR